jgi:hypothetical protein
MERPVGVGAFDWMDARRRGVPVEEMVYLDETASREDIDPYAYGEANPRRWVIPAIITGNASAPRYDWQEAVPNEADSLLLPQDVAGVPPSQTSGGSSLDTTYEWGIASALEIGYNVAVPVGTYVLLIPCDGQYGEAYLFSYPPCCAGSGGSGTEPTTSSTVTWNNQTTIVYEGAPVYYEDDSSIYITENITQTTIVLQGGTIVYTGGRRSTTSGVPPPITPIQPITTTTMGGEPIIPVSGGTPTIPTITSTDGGQPVVDPSSPFRQPPFGSPPVFGSDPPPSFGGSNRGQRQQGGGPPSFPWGGPSGEWPGPFSGNNRGQRQNNNGGVPILPIVGGPGGGQPIVPLFQNNPKQPILPIFAQNGGKPIVPPFAQPGGQPLLPIVGGPGGQLFPITQEQPAPPGQIVYDLPASFLDSVYFGESVWVGGGLNVAGIISGIGSGLTNLPVSALPVATDTTPGIVEPDGVTLIVVSGVIALNSAGIPGYNGGAQQILGHDASGNPAWFSVTSC